MTASPKRGKSGAKNMTVDISEVHNLRKDVDDLRDVQQRQGQTLASVVTKLDTIGTQISSLNTTIGQQQERETESSKTKWNTVITAGVFFLAIITAVGSAVLTPISNNVHKNSLAISEERLRRLTHEESDGHTETLILVSGLQKDIERIDGDVDQNKILIDKNNEESRTRHETAIDRLMTLDDSLQREMRDLDTISSTRMDALDTNLQREMRMLSQLSDAKREGLENKIDEVDKYMLMLFEQEKRISALKAELDSIIGSVD